MATLAYVVNPIPVLGFIDDAAAIVVVLKSIESQVTRSIGTPYALFYTKMFLLILMKGAKMDVSLNQNDLVI